jgi:hypothetical protein
MHKKLRFQGGGMKMAKSAKAASDPLSLDLPDL